MGITSDDILTTAYMESHGFIRKVQEQKLYPQINVCYGAQYGGGGWLVEKRKNPSVQSYNLDSSFPGCCDICGVYMHAKSLQSCRTLCNPVKNSPPGSSVHGILQARKLEWIAIPPSKGSSQPGNRSQVSHLLHYRQILHLLSHLGSWIFVVLIGFLQFIICCDLFSR